MVRKGSKNPAQTHVAGNTQPLIASAGYRLWMPHDLRLVRVLLVINQRGAGKRLFWHDEEWRMLAERVSGGILFCEFDAPTVRDNGYGQSLLCACKQFAEQLGHPELCHVRFVLWGHSMGGRAVQDFILFCPERIAAFHIAMRRYSSAPELMDESAESMKVPGLYLMGSEDLQPQDIRTHFDRSRRHDAPRAWVRLPGQGHWPRGMDMNTDHTSLTDWRQWMAQDLVIPWVEAILRLRLNPVSFEGNTSQIISEIDTMKGWLGDNETFQITPCSVDSGDPSKASWLPDENVARAWASVVGKPIQRQG